jgi:hypothetical protein
MHQQPYIAAKIAARPTTKLPLVVQSGAKDDSAAWTVIAHRWTRFAASIEHPLFDQFKVAIDVEHIRLRSRGTHANRKVGVGDILRIEQD